MGEDADREREIAFQIGCSKAIRNVVVNAFPQKISDFAFAEVRNALVDKIGKELPKWRATNGPQARGQGGAQTGRGRGGRPAGEWLAPERTGDRDDESHF